MKKCTFCEKRIETLSFHCKYCGKSFCSEHRLPENHSCSFVLVSDSLEDLLYEDTIEFMEKDLTVADIYHYFTIKEFTAEKTIDLLKFFLENNENIENKVNCIHALKLLNLKNDTIFTILEECVISDKSSEVKNAAIKVLKELFPEKSKNLLKWFNNSGKKI